MDHSPHSVFARILGNTGILIGSRVVNAVCSFVYVAWAAQALGLQNFGIMLLVTTFAAMICDVTHLQSWQSLLHYGTSYFEKKQFDRFNDVLIFCIRADFLSGLVGMLAGLAGVALLGSSFMGWSKHIQFDAALCMLTILCMNTGWSTGMLRLCNHFKLVPVYEFLTSCVRTAGTGIGFFCHFGIGYFLLVWSLSQLTMFVSCSCAGIYLVKKHIGHFPSLSSILSTKTRIPDIWSYTVKTSINQVLESFFSQGATLLIGGRLGASEAAVYKVARQISNGLAKPAQLMIPTLYPEFIRMRDAQDWNGIRNVILKIFGIIIAFSLISLTLTAPVGNRLFSYMLHDVWPGQQTILLLLVGGSLLDICLIPLEPFLVMVDRISILLRWRVIVMCLYFPLLFVFMRVGGIKGASLETLLASLMMFVVCALPVLRLLNQKVAQTPQMQ
ncbi:oligosaccharide flippase family protein [Acetobacter lambici]|uniref:Lipopolysaccharide biosynthesis protein n=1 Tax=Acetobacter lambici TaxID=1332824 RepID=A0ABT1F4W6_9PROT|nr:lipopolysaccharide biosynthesis protein [Acetobacter lambici]MCP1244159.1 lipopolysaccharide biosynthesis protein [Acetobacter lambici]MCP1259996.1 lipopolysaccharide biosynthesis protein [Acetobacter lambici]NHO58170.1 oligosaccharide flippase family protein [Acetobacter lambici]